MVVVEGGKEEEEEVEEKDMKDKEEKEEKGVEIKRTGVGENGAEQKYDGGEERK